MARAGLNTDRVVSAAAELADEVGIEHLTLSALAARLGVRQPSLYKHVDSLDALRHGIAVQAKGELADVMGAAAVGLAGADALTAIAHAYRAWAHRHPGRYQAAQRPPVAGHAADEAVSTRAIGVLVAVMEGYGLTGDDVTDAIRGFRACIHGFVALEASGAFALPAHVDRSFTRLINTLTAGLNTWPE